LQAVVDSTRGDLHQPRPQKLAVDPIPFERILVIGIDDVAQGSRPYSRVGTVAQIEARAILAKFVLRFRAEI
jgi:hypothetical protein